MAAERDPTVWVAQAVSGQGADGEDGASLPVRICRACVRELPVDGAALSLTTAGLRRAIVGASDDIVASIEELEITVGEGPGTEAIACGGPVLISNLSAVASSRWPAFMPLMAGTGMAAVFALPIQRGVVGLGVLTLCRREPGNLSPQQLATALRVTDLVALLIAGSRDSGGSGPRGGFDHRWLDGLDWTREVDQATGMLTVQLGVGAEEAFVRLRGYAFAHNLSLAQVARDIVVRRLRLADDGAGSADERE